MTKQQKRLNVIKYLLSEQPQYSEIEIPAGEQEQKILLRSLFNIRMPLPVTNDFLRVQDAYLQEEIRQKGITTLSALEPIQKEIYLWRGDITTLQCDGIVNAPATCWAASARITVVLTTPFTLMRVCSFVWLVRN